MSDKKLQDSSGSQIERKSIKILSFNARYSILKKNLDVPADERKTQIDSLLKKSNSKFFKSVHLALKKCLKCQVDRLPQKFITNIKIQFVKKYLEKTIFLIYKENCDSREFDEEFIRNNVREDKKELLNEFLSMTFSEAFEFYITSQHYVKDYESIREKEGDKVAVLFNYISKIFIEYYTLSKGNSKKSE